jgi:uncharacterized membrane protein
MATLAPILDADWNIQIHAASASIAMVLLPFVLWRQRRDRLHKNLGYIWVCAMGFAALSSFTISNFPLIGPFSFLHALAVLTLYTLVSCVRAAIRGDIQRHRSGLRNLATFGLGLPFALNFLPERSYSRALELDDPMVGLWCALAALLAITLWRIYKIQNGGMNILGALRGDMH